jgi:hypothetical protein
MSELKTKPTACDVRAFINAIEHPVRRENSLTLLELFETITKQKAVLWGDSIIGFGQYHYQYASGCSGDWMKTGFSPRKTNLSLYLMNGFAEYDELLAQLGKHKLGKSCLYINKLADIDIEILTQLIKLSYVYMSKKYD